MGDIKCTLTDEQLIEACDKWVSKFCESGGKAWTLQVPVNMNEDPDMLLTELANRFKQRLSFQPAVSPIDWDKLREDWDGFCFPQNNWHRLVFDWFKQRIG